MAVKLRLKRLGRKNHPFYRLNAIDSRSPRDGRVIEDLGHYDPIEKDKAKQFSAQLDKCRAWLDKGAIPSETVSSLLKKSGVEHRMLFQRVDDDPNDEGQVGELLAGLRLESRAHFLTQTRYAREIDLEERSDMSGAPPLLAATGELQLPA